MPYRAVVSGELARLFSVLSHATRIRIVEELQREDLTVGTLKEILGITHAAVSQQLSVLRSHHLVSEKRQGRNVFYHLRKPELAKWIMDGVQFILPDTNEVQTMVSAIESARSAWNQEQVEEAKSSRKAGAKNLKAVAKPSPKSNGKTAGAKTSAPAARNGSRSR
jgi:DNA-binding transcriptional ArsR family regulator